MPNFTLFTIYETALGAALKALRKLEIYRLSLAEVELELIIPALGTFIMLIIALASYN